MSAALSLKRPQIYTLIAIQTGGAVPQPGDDECTAQFKRFVFAAAHAGGHGVPVFMDT